MCSMATWQACLGHPKNSYGLSTTGTRPPSHITVSPPAAWQGWLQQQHDDMTPQQALPDHWDMQVSSPPSPRTPYYFINAGVARALGAHWTRPPATSFAPRGSSMKLIAIHPDGDLDHHANGSCPPALLPERGAFANDRMCGVLPHGSNVKGAR